MTGRDFKQIVSITGAFIAFMIGSGFATGQEILQYYAGYGFMGICGIGVCLILLIYAATAFTRAGYREQFARPNGIYEYYFGKKLGLVFDYFTVISIYLCYVVMLAGAGAAIKQHLGLPVTVGGILIGVLSCVTVMFGLQKMVDVISKIGPLIIVLVVSLAVITIVQGDVSRLGEINAEIQANDTLLRASNNWFMSACSYLGISITWLATFMTALGKDAYSLKNATIGSIAGVVAFLGSMVLMVIAFMLNIDSLANTEIPTLILADKVSPVLGSIFAFVVVVGIYTTAVPLLWTTVSRFAEDRTKKFTMLTIILAAVGMVVGMLIPFSKLVNVVYVLIGDFGFVLIAFILIKHIRTKKW